MGEKRRIRFTLTGILCAATWFVSGMAQTESSDDACYTAVPEYEIIARIGRGTIHDMEVSPDGSALAIASSRGVWLYDAATLELQSSLLLPDETGATSVSWSPYGSELAVGYPDGVRIWNTENGELVRWHSKIPDVTHVVWSPAGHRLAVLNTGFVFEGMDSIIYSDLRVIEPYSDYVLMRQADVRGNLDQAVWSPDGSHLLYLNHVGGFSVGDTDSDYVLPTVLAFIWSEYDAGQSNVETFLSDNPFPLRSAAWSPDGTRIALDIHDMGNGEVQIRDASSGALIQTLTAGANPMWSADGSHFTVYQEDYAGFRVWSGGLENERFTPVGQVKQFTFSPDGSRLYANQWGTLVAYDTSDGQVVASLDLHPYRQLEAAWSPDGALLATRHGDDPAGNATVFIWDAAGELFHRITTSDTIHSIYWSPTGSALALAKSRTVEIHDLSGGLPLVIDAEHPFRLAWSPEGGRIAAILRSGDVYVWNAGSGETLEHILSPVESLSGTAMSGDSRIVWSPASGLRWLIRDWDGFTRLYSLDQEASIGDLGVLDFIITAGTPQFLPDGRLYYTLRGSPMTIYDVDAGEVVETYRLRAEISQVSPSYSLECYAAAGFEEIINGQMRIALPMYSLEDGVELNRLSLPTMPENTFRSRAVAWSPDGRRAAVILTDGTLLLWGSPVENP